MYFVELQVGDEEQVARVENLEWKAYRNSPT